MEPGWVPSGASGWQSLDYGEALCGRARAGVSVVVVT